MSQDDPRIHGNCITCTVTGRVSMFEPNLQNVPKDFSCGDDNFVISVRMAFVPALGNIILSADYCQLELRLLTHFSQDSVLCEIMKQEGDIFKSIAAKWNNVTEEEVIFITINTLKYDENIRIDYSYLLFICFLSLKYLGNQ